MKLSELRELASRRTRGEWRFGVLPHPSGLLRHFWIALTNQHLGECKKTDDGMFIEAMANNIDKLLDVVEAAKFAMDGLETAEDDHPELYRTLAALEAE